MHYIIFQVDARPECCVCGRIKEVEEEEEGEGERDITSFTDLILYTTNRVNMTRIVIGLCTRECHITCTCMQKEMMETRKFLIRK